MLAWIVAQRASVCRVRPRCVTVLVSWTPAAGAEPLPYVPAPLVRKSRFSHENELIDAIGLPLCERYVHNGGMIYGYARVSTDGQSVEAQVAALTAAGAVKVYREVASGAKTPCETSHATTSRRSLPAW